MRMLKIYFYHFAPKSFNYLDLSISQERKLQFSLKHLMKLCSSYKVYTINYCQNTKGYCIGQVNFNCSCKVFQIVMTIFQLRYYAHHPSSTCLPNQRLN